MKKFLLVAGACFGILFLVIGGGLWLIVRAGAHSAEDVAKLCTTPLGTNIELVIPHARSLGFNAERRGALEYGIEVYEGTSDVRATWPNDSLPGITNGRIMFGKVVLPPFMRNYCEIKFADRKVSGTRVIQLD